MKIKFLILAAAALSLGACSQVSPGHVGIKVNRWGSDAGVSTEALGMGTYYAGPGTSIEEYPVFTSTKVWTASSTEGSKTNEEFTFADKSGLSLTGDVAVSYHVIPQKAPVLYQKYRTDMEGIVDGPMRVAIRNAINNEASQMSVEEIYGPRKAELIAKATKDVQKFFTPFGLEIEQLYWASPIRVPDIVRNQINQKIANEQAALSAQASVATAEAEARSEIAKAEGHAKAMTIEGQAIASNPQILQEKAIARWSGNLPQYMGAGAPMPFLNVK